MVSPVRPTALRWVLLCALALAVLGMHHLSAAGSHHAPEGQAVMPGAVASAVVTHTDAMASACCEYHQFVTAQPGHSSGGGHDLLHLCLAILVAAAALTLAWLLRQRSPSAAPQRHMHVAAQRASRSPPPRRPSDLLSSLCVLRL